MMLRLRGSGPTLCPPVLMPMCESLFCVVVFPAHLVRAFFPACCPRRFPGETSYEQLDESAGEAQLERAGQRSQRERPSAAVGTGTSTAPLVGATIAEEAPVAIDAAPPAADAAV